MKRIRRWPPICSSQRDGREVWEKAWVRRVKCKFYELQEFGQPGLCKWPGKPVSDPAIFAIVETIYLFANRNCLLKVIAWANWKFQSKAKHRGLRDYGHSLVVNHYFPPWTFSIVCCSLGCLTHYAPEERNKRKRLSKRFVCKTFLPVRQAGGTLRWESRGKKAEANEQRQESRGKWAVVMD